MLDKKLEKHKRVTKEIDDAEAHWKDARVDMDELLDPVWVDARIMHPQTIEETAILQRVADLRANIEKNIDDLYAEVDISKEVGLEEMSCDKPGAGSRTTAINTQIGHLGRPTSRRSLETIL